MTTRRHSPAGDWPLDPDVTADDVAERPDHHRLDVRRIGVVLAGGLVGGLVRYEAVTQWAAAPGSFPWSTFVVNTAGALILGVLVIVVLEVLGPSVYARPLIGAGFCGALTTFSSLAVQVDELAAHHNVGMASGYLGLSLGAGLAAAAIGVVIGRALPPTSARRAMSSEA
jgi:CrcB protein